MKKKLALVISSIFVLSLSACANTVEEKNNLQQTSMPVRTQEKEKDSHSVVNKEKSSKKEHKKQTYEATDVSRFYGYNLPLLFICDYKERKDGSWKFDIKKRGQDYFVKGTIMCPECIDINLIGNAKVGSKVKTGSGREYCCESHSMTYN